MIRLRIEINGLNGPARIAVEILASSPTRGRGQRWARYQGMGNTLMSAPRSHFGLGECCEATLINSGAHQP